MDSFLGSSSGALNLCSWACLITSVMYCRRRVASTPKKKSRSGSLLDSCFLLGRYLASTSSRMASSYMFFTESSG